MSFSDLAAFRLTITDHLDVGSRITNSKLDDLITIGENKVNKQLRVRQMETALAATLGSTAGTASVPSDYLDLKYAYMNTSPVRRLERKSPGWIYEKFPTRSQGTEMFVAREGSEFIFGECGTPGRVMKGIYYAKPTAMATTINSLFSAYPEIFLFAVLSESEAYLGRDPRIALWEQKYQQYLALANGMDKDENYSGSPLSAVVS